jgi:hypothetical protein
MTLSRKIIVRKPTLQTTKKFFIKTIFYCCSYSVCSNGVLRSLCTKLSKTAYWCIINTALTNGFNKKLVDKITTFRRLKHIKETTTLSTLDKDVTYNSHEHTINLTKSSNTTI